MSLLNTAGFELVAGWALTWILSCRGWTAGKTREGWRFERADGMAFVGGASALWHAWQRPFTVLMAREWRALMDTQLREARQEVAEEQARRAQVEAHYASTVARTSIGAAVECVALIRAGLEQAAVMSDEGLLEAGRVTELALAADKLIDSLLKSAAAISDYATQRDESLAKLDGSPMRWGVWRELQRLLTAARKGRRQAEEALAFTLEEVEREVARGLHQRAHAARRRVSA